MASPHASIRAFAHLFRRHVLRYIGQHPLLAALNVLSVGLGVAVYLATQIANQSANRAFMASVDLVAGRADLQITAPGGLHDDVLPQVLKATGIAAATPIVRGFVTMPQWPGEYVDLLGIDVFTNEAFRTFDLAGFDGKEIDLENWLGNANTIAVSEEFATQHNLHRGDVVRAQLNGIEQSLRVAFLLKKDRDSLADPHFAAIDIGWAQELFRRRGVLSSIQLRLASGADRAHVVDGLRQLVPPDATIASPAQRGEQVEKMLGGFELNLTAMSLVSLLVGMFLIYNSVSASVVRRRHEIGILRSLGTTRGEVRALFLGEAAALSGLGIIIGLTGGVLLSRGLTHVVAGTISSLYFLVNVTSLRIAGVTVVTAAAIGVLSSLTAAWLPAREASEIAPVEALPGAITAEHRRPPQIVWLGSGALAILLAAALSFLALTTGPRWLAFIAAFFVLTGFSVLVPPIAARFSSSSARLLRAARAYVGMVEAEIAAANLGRALMRNSITIASLAAAIAMTVGVTVMVFSFRTTVQAWIDQTLLADLFIAPASNEVVGPSSFVPPGAIPFLESQPEVEAIDTFREIDLPFRSGTIAVAVVRGSPRRTLQFIRGDGAEILKRFYSDECVLVSEPFARRHRLRDGDVLDLPTPLGVRRFPIAGTFYDYTRDQGVVFISTKNFQRSWKDDRVNSLAIYLKSGAAADSLITRFRQQFSRAGEFMIFSNASLRQRVFEIFDQTFAVTYVLRTIAVIVALIGIFLSLTTLIVERSRELAVIRALGGSAAQVRRLLLWEAAFIGMLAAVVGIISGVCLSVVLTGVINRAFFGWTIRLAFPWAALLLTPTWIIAAAVIAAIVPAWRAGRLSLSEALRAE
ncbi:MAG: FtsX-like permease family protein [Chthoniobacterales bacterium]